MKELQAITLKLYKNTKKKSGSLYFVESTAYI